ncbi:LPPG domain containing protein [Methanococcus vannielii SB]|uniref:2-phospho-L-lactate transferase n=1 Tax=Methanococcus vannielii (strain ATCC 35089 / DSM 1224 / JCM 13029 / OCM 148 / SB) TaxID=406327 RepID=COFD_METVS|nr:2-phospho-L-lactate transferase [Methanococcus vannielii]A6US17.1 RecName: Full=2-phospho-L-lactate transferase [Methanococcus vannielii SB]ABR55289.1 LPPG domain containing protein [Methanococcus vannielii SB]
MKITILSGGTGTPKLIQGFKKIIPNKDISVIVNTGEDTYIGDLYLSPDIDTVIYTFSDIINDETWYGLKEDTFFCHEQLKNYGFNEVLKIGDRDRALKMHKTALLKKGIPLSEIVELEKSSLNITSKIYPMSNDLVQSKILIEENGEKLLLKFHDFWIFRKGNANVLDVFYENSNYAKPADGVLRAIEESDFVVIGPSNPITSIGPILSIKEIKEALKEKIVFAVSPIIGENPVSGPTGTLMSAKGYSVDVTGIYGYYKDIVNVMVIDSKDINKKKEIECDVLCIDTIMKTIEDKVNLSKNIVEYYKSKCTY